MTGQLIYGGRNASSVGVHASNATSHQRNISSTYLDLDARRVRMTAANVPIAPDSIKFETPARRVNKNEKSQR
jgi:hypothetical protein